MSKPSETAKRGYTLEDAVAHEDLAPLSLRIAIRAYFDSGVVADAFLSSPTDLDPVRTNLRYAEAVFTTCVHLQHFAELVLKRLLRSEHELLALESPDESHTVTFRKLLRNEPISEFDKSQLNTVEFSRALKRVEGLLKAPPDEKSSLNSASPWATILKHKEFLTALNTVRNRMWHRGRFILDYDAFDELIGGSGLGFVQDVVVLLEDGKKVRRYLYPKPLACKVEPISEIRARIGAGKFDPRAIAFLKALGRAAFRNPKLQGGLTLAEAQAAEDAELTKSHPALVGLSGVLFDTGIIEAARGRAELRRREDGLEYEVSRGPCPVCGEDYFFVRTVAYLDEETGQWGPEYEDKAECIFCGLELYPSFGNPSEHGLTSIADVWSTAAGTDAAGTSQL